MTNEVFSIVYTVWAFPFPMRVRFVDSTWTVRSTSLYTNSCLHKIIQSIKYVNFSIKLKRKELAKHFQTNKKKSHCEQSVPQALPHLDRPLNLYWITFSGVPEIFHHIYSVTVTFPVIYHILFDTLVLCYRYYRHLTRICRKMGFFFWSFVRWNSLFMDVTHLNWMFYTESVLVDYGLLHAIVFIACLKRRWIK